MLLVLSGQQLAVIGRPRTSMDVHTNVARRCQRGGDAERGVSTTGVVRGDADRQSQHEDHGGHRSGAAAPVDQGPRQRECISRNTKEWMLTIESSIVRAPLPRREPSPVRDRVNTVLEGFGVGLVHESTALMAQLLTPTCGHEYVRCRPGGVRDECVARARQR